MAFNLDHNKDGDAFEDLGLIDFSNRKTHQTNLYVGYNWLHYLSQIIILLNKETDCSQLIDLIAA